MPNDPRTERIAAIRALRHLDSQADFAAKVGVTRGTIIELEKGTMPSLRTARALVNLGLDPRHVLPQTTADHGPHAA